METFGLVSRVVREATDDHRPPQLLLPPMREDHQGQQRGAQLESRGCLERLSSPTAPYPASAPTRTTVLVLGGIPQCIPSSQDTHAVPSVLHVASPLRPSPPRRQCPPQQGGNRPRQPRRNPTYRCCPSEEWRSKRGANSPTPLKVLDLGKPHVKGLRNPFSYTSGPLL